MEAGNYYLTANVEIHGAWRPASGVVLCLNGHSITSTIGNAIIVEGNKTFTITDCTGKGKITASDNVGIYNNGTLNIYGGSIADCRHTDGYDAGGGVYNNYNGTLNMYGGSITNNTVSQTNGCWGGGVNNKGTFNMYSGSITGNTVTGPNSGYGWGGGVYNTGIFEMTGGTISGNTATVSGGGVYNRVNGSSGKFTMSGGTIGGTGESDANSARNGGGVCIDHDGIFEMSDTAVITGNKADMYGGGVYNKNGTFTVSGSVQITDNKKGDADNNLYLGSNQSINGGSLTTDARIGITAQENQTVVTGSTNTTIFTSDSDSYELTAASSNLKLTKKTAPHVHCVCGTGTLTASGHTHYTQEWTGVSSLSEITTGGYYYLTNNVTITSSSTPNYWQPPTGVVLCLNGYSITSEASAEVIQVAGGRTLTITDCQGTGKIKHASSTNGRGVFVMSNGTFNMCGGSITGNATTASAGGGGVYNGGTFNMYGGTISENTAAHSGGGVYNSGTFTMSGNAVISNNTADLNGGGVWSYVLGGEGVSFTMDGGSITGNKATGAYSGYGGGVYAQNGTVTLKGAAKITGNTSGSATAPTTNNLYLPNNMTVTANELSGSASIGVTTATKPTSGNSIVITNDGCSTAYFRSDVEGYTVEASGAAVALAVEQITPTTYTVAVNATHATPATSTQSVTVGSSMANVTLTAADGYYFTNVTVPSGFTASVADDSASVAISGTPTANITINVSATAKTKPATPSVTGVAPSSASGTGTLQGTTTAMEYKAADATTWTDCVANQPVNPGSYEVRVKATNTTLASETVSVTVPAYVPDVNPDPKPNPETAPSIINGNGATAKKGEAKALSFTSSAARDALVRVELDGTKLDAANYTVSSGSTVVTLNAEYVATLAAGEHTLSIVSSNGTATANFTIQAASPTPDDPDTKPDTKPDDEAKPDDGKKADTKPDGKSAGAKQPPRTGDESNAALWLLLLVGSGAGMATLGKKKRYSK